MPTRYDPYGYPDPNRIADLIRARGEIEAQRSAASADIWGRGIQDIVGHLGAGLQSYAQATEQERQAKAMKARDAAWVTYVEGKEWLKDPGQAVGVALRIWGPDAPKHLAGLESAQKMAMEGQTKPNPEQDSKDLGNVASALMGMTPPGRARLYPSARAAVIKKFPDAAAQLPEQYDASVDELIGAFANAYGPAKEKTATRAVTVKNPDGSETTQIVKDEPGQTFTSAAKPATSQWGQPFTGPDGLSYQRNEQTDEIRRTPGVGAKAAEPAPELTLNPEGVVLSGYGVKQKEEARKQARERGIPVFENSTTQLKGVTLNSIVQEAKELQTLLALPKVKDAIGPAAGRWEQFKSGFVSLDPDVQRAFQLMGGLSDTELRKRTGAASGEPEMQRILKFSVDPNKPLGHNTVALAGMLKSGARDYKALSGVDIGGIQADAGLPTVTTKAEFQALPSGTEFIDPEGNKRRKP